MNNTDVYHDVGEAIGNKLMNHMVDEMDKLKKELNECNAIIYSHTHQSITWRQDAFQHGELDSFIVPGYKIFVVEQVIKKHMKVRDLCHIEVVTGSV